MKMRWNKIYWIAIFSKKKIGQSVTDWTVQIAIWCLLQWNCCCVPSIWVSNCYALPAVCDWIDVFWNHKTKLNVYIFYLIIFRMIRIQGIVDIYRGVLSIQVRIYWIFFIILSTNRRWKWIMWINVYYIAAQAAIVIVFPTVVVPVAL